jgi:hypothetical protein
MLEFGMARVCFSSSKSIEMGCVEAFSAPRVWFLSMPITFFLAVSSLFLFFSRSWFAIRIDSECTRYVGRVHVDRATVVEEDLR